MLELWPKIKNDLLWLEVLKSGKELKIIINQSIEPSKNGLLNKKLKSDTHKNNPLGAKLLTIIWQKSKVGLKLILNNFSPSF